MRVCIHGAGLVLAACLAGCGGSGDLSGDLAATQADYQIIDLVTGGVEARAEVTDLASNPAWRDRHLVVRRLPERVAVIGQAQGTYAAQPDEIPTSHTQAPCYLAVFELTRAQWRRIASDEPWLAVQPSSLAGVGGDDLPACGISHDRAVAALTAFRQRGVDFSLPDDEVWESTAHQETAVFPWGDARDTAVVATAAVVAETAGGTIGPQAVGGRAPAPSGCYDLIGNVAEWTSAGNLRGGSWSDPLSLARPANVREVEPDLPLATAGVRVLFHPASR